jgi:hypothetical protein
MATYTLPTFTSLEAARAAINAADTHIARPTATVHTDRWGQVSFSVIGELVEFRAHASATSGEAYTVTGNLGLDGADAESEVRDFLPASDDDQDEAAYSLMERTEDAVTDDLLADVAGLWLALPDRERFALIRDGATTWATSLAAEHWMQTNEPGKRRGQALLALKSHADRVRDAHCRAVAYTLPGAAGVAARRLLVGGWHGDADELITAAEGIASP